ncbi:sulfite reductase subunit alpha [Methylovirgula sp. HY1]|uniref:sulfite reductase subunit alpha n=1 Tax=Methylovirgula sp. HY1 TaxID=2822761 RepID=UPI001C5B6AC9|nr:sulfite reductase subunit alpha [Methylovirgula sp. HY1]QXX74870.1 Sulfite reductase [NADPH] flavoprotein alpha-component [Methylovirgula sp. HY1]
MSFSSPPPAMVPLLPENAPFTPEQRAWLNGFFAGAFAPAMPGALPITADAVAALAKTDTAPQAEIDDGAPWHDPAMAFEERMKHAEGRPLRRRLMAAMAQQDCGQCGYMCESYADAIANGGEKRLNLCVPGEKITARTLKSLVEESPATPQAPAPKAAVVPAPKTIQKAPGYTRESPVDVTFLSRRRLTKEGSEKAAYHIEFDLSRSGLDYAVGDSFGIYPQNDPALVDAVLAAIHAPPDFPIMDRTLRDVLLNDVALGMAPDALFALLSYITGGERRHKAKQLAKGEDPDGDAAGLDVLATFEKFSGVHPDPEALVECLDPLQPRLYSISSSPKAIPGLLSLTVDHVRYFVGERLRQGVASSFLAERLQEGAKLKAYVQRAHNFALPARGDTPIIMIGPGTGVAPFRAFLQERQAQGATGGAWLFFGHQHQATDFFYEEEMEALQKQGVLTHLSLAWSRDDDKKVYVQDRLREAGWTIWEWIARGAHLYICGDASRMAGDVEKAFIDIVAEHSRRDTDSARQFVQEMKRGGSYQTDVY